MDVEMESVVTRLSHIALFGGILDPNNRKLQTLRDLYCQQPYLDKLLSQVGLFIFAFILGQSVTMITPSHPPCSRKSGSHSQNCLASLFIGKH